MNIKNKKMGLVWLSAAFVFLFNPNLNIIDILPDFIGYIFLCIGLSRLADMNDDIAAAHKGFGRALVADLLKIASMFLVFGTQNPEEQQTMLLLVSFIFAFAELIILIPAFNSLFGGLIGLGYRFENTSVLGAVRHRRKNRTEIIRSITIFFLIVKTAAFALPEFAVLSTQSYDEMASTFYMYDFIGLLRGFAIFISLIVGVIWLLRILRYFAQVKRDETFLSEIASYYEKNILPRRSLFVRKAVKLMTLFFFASALLSIDLRLESFNVVIDTLAAVALIVGFFAVRKYIGSVKKSLVPFIAYAVLSLAAVITEFGFFDKYYYGAIARSDEAYEAYILMLVFAVLDALGFLVAVWGMGNMLLSVIREHTGFYVPSASINVDDKIKRVHKELNLKVYLLYGAAVFAAATDIFYDFFARSLRFAGLVNIVGSVIFIFAVFSACFTIIDEVEAKYMLE